MTALSRTERVAAGIAVAAVAALVGVGALALLVGIPVASTSGSSGMTGGPGMMGGPSMMGGPGGFPFVLFPFMFLTFAALFVLGSVGVRALTGAKETDQVDDDETVGPVTRIKRRYTDGELTEAEFERALERELADGESDRDGENQTDLENRPDLEATNAERSVSGRERQ